MGGYKTQIASKIKQSLQQVTVANGYSQDLRTITFDQIRLNISDYNDYEIPAIQIIDLSSNVNHEMTRSKTSWFLTLEICLRSTLTLGVINQEKLWDLQEDIIRAIMIDPRLGLNFVVSVKIIDSLTDLHFEQPNYIANIGLEIEYYEPITRLNC